MLAVVRLATFHPHHLIRDQHQISIALASETRNLRSTVARSAIFTIGELFSKLRSQIESVSIEYSNYILFVQVKMDVMNFVSLSLFLKTQGT